MEIFMKLQKVLILYSIFFMGYSNCQANIFRSIISKIPKGGKFLFKEKAMPYDTTSYQPGVLVHKPKEEALDNYIKLTLSHNESFEQIKNTIIKEAELDGSVSLSDFFKNKANEELFKLFNKKNRKESCDFNDSQKAFDFLKQRLNVPHVKLFISMNPQDMPLARNILQPKPHRLLFYNIYNEAIYETPESLFESSSQRLFTYIHELKHAQQIQQLGLSEFLEYKRRGQHSLLEHDADTKAAEYIQCPLCLKVTIAQRLECDNPSIRTKLGYLDGEDLINHLKQKSLKDLCKAHQSVENPDIWSGLDTKEGREKIIVDDYKIPSICDRLIK